MPKLCIATPAYGGLHPAYSASLLKTQWELARHGIAHVILTEPNDSLVSRARCVLAARFLGETDCDRLLMIDSDLEWTAEDVMRLLCAMESPDIEVACGVYPRKSREVSFPVNFMIDEERRLTWHDQTGYVEVKDAPTGFLMIKRSVLERMMAAYPERQCQFRDYPVGGPEFALFDCFIDGESRHYLSEDFGFSRLWQRIGGRIWADPEISLAHFGQFKYTGSIKSVFQGLKVARAEDIDGWMSSQELAFLYGAAAGMESVIEVGSWKGRSTFALLSGCKGPVWAVDHWRGTEGEPAHAEANTRDVFEVFMDNVGRFPNLRVRQMESLEAATLGLKADMVFIDAAHDYESVRADIEAWRPAAGRLLCGHDFTDTWPEVMRAVRDSVGEPDLVVGSIWVKRVR